jgi:hypothetical protein
MEINDKLIEIEIQKRVCFRLDEIRKQIKTGKRAAEMADRGSMGHLYTRGGKAAWVDIDNILEKEITMGTPFDGDFIKRTWERKEIVVNKISERLLKKGTRDYGHLKSFINDKIERFIDGH